MKEKLIHFFLPNGYSGSESVSPSLLCGNCVCMRADPAEASGWSNAFVHEIKVQRCVTRAVRPLAVRLEAGGTFLTSLLRGIRPLKGERGHIWLVCSKVLEDGGLYMWSVWHFELLISACFITSCERQQCYFSGEVCSARCLLWNVKELDFAPCVDLNVYEVKLFYILLVRYVCFT